MTTRQPSTAELRRKARERFATASRLEREYARSLRLLSRQVGVMAMMHADDPTFLFRVLSQYAEQVGPWARKVAEKMVLRVAVKDEEAWDQLGKEIGRELRKELQYAPTGQALRAYLEEQVKLIQSLPREAAECVMHIVGTAAVEGRRADDVKEAILTTGKVTESRARLIARTEVARISNGLTMVRAQHVGSTHYVWRTTGDGDVRESHKKMNGKIIPWAEPEEVEPGHRYHAGMFPNCRCYCEPVLPSV